MLWGRGGLGDGAAGKSQVEPREMCWRVKRELVLKRGESEIEGFARFGRAV